MSKPQLHELIRFVRTHSYREGNFTLASGQKSSYYVDLKATTLHPEGAYLIGELALDVLEREAVSLGQPIEAVGGLTLGADPLATAISLAARARGKTWPAFIVRKESKGHGTSRWIEGTENLRAGANVLVLEDVVTTGGSSILAIEKLRDAGYNPLAALTVVDREQGGAKKITALGVRFLSLMSLVEVRAAQPNS